MALENLQLFRDIAHTRSVSKGARANGISQSAASQQMQELERQLGITLLDRSTRPLILTPAGKLYLEYCRDALRRRDEFEAELHRLKHDTRGKFILPLFIRWAFRKCRILKRAFPRASQPANWWFPICVPKKYLKPFNRTKPIWG